jgi:hypothetical protein
MTSSALAMVTGLANARLNSIKVKGDPWSKEILDASILEEGIKSVQ